MEEAKVSCVVSEVTFRSTWVWGLVARTNHLVRALECSVPPPWPPQRGGGWRLSSTTSGQWFNQLCLCNSSVQFSCSVMSDSLWPHGLQHATLPCPSLSPRVCSNLCLLSWWCHPTISSSVALFSCPQSFPASRSCTRNRLFSSGGQSIGASTSASVLPMNIQGWFPLGGFPCWLRWKRIHL